MANHKSAEKRIRQTAKRTAINRARVSRVRTFVKRVETAIATGDRATEAVERCGVMDEGPGSLALPTAAHASAVQFTLLAASGMIGNQRLQHFGEPRGKSFRSDTLGGNAGALA